MAISLRPGEEIKHEAQFHWSNFLFTKVWAVVGVCALLALLISQFSGQASRDLNLVAGLVTITVLFFAPLLSKWLEFKCKAYIITNQRIYVESGVLSKSMRDISIEKINDVTMTQGILQRLFGSGNIWIFTGHDMATVLTNLDQPEAFKNAISTGRAQPQR